MAGQTFPSADAAREAARIAAIEQSQSGDDGGITFEDAFGRWHEALFEKNDRPNPVVLG